MGLVTAVEESWCGRGHEAEHGRTRGRVQTGLGSAGPLPWRAAGREECDLFGVEHSPSGSNGAVSPGAGRGGLLLL